MASSGLAKAPHSRVSDRARQPEELHEGARPRRRHARALRCQRSAVEAETRSDGCGLLKEFASV